MASCRGFVLLLTLNMVALAVYGSTCVSTPKCSCDFDGEKDVGTTKSEMLAGAVGAMSPLLAAGAGFGVYKLIQSRTGSSKFGFERAPSDLTDDSYQDTKQKKFQRGRRNSTTPLRTDTSEYNSSRRGSDFNSSRRGSNDTTLSVTDWDVDSDRMGSPVSSSEVSTRITPSFQPQPPSAVKKDNINMWMS